MRTTVPALLLKVSAESFKDDRTGDQIHWTDVSLLVDMETINGSTPKGVDHDSLLSGLNGSRKAFEEGKLKRPVPVEADIEFLPRDAGGRSFKVKVHALTEAS